MNKPTLYQYVQCKCGQSIHRAASILLALERRGIKPKCFECKKKRTHMMDMKRKKARLSTEAVVSKKRT